MTLKEHKARPKTQNDAKVSQTNFKKKGQKRDNRTAEKNEPNQLNEPQKSLQGHKRIRKHEPAPETEYIRMRSLN